MTIIEALKSVGAETDATVDSMIQILTANFAADDPADGAFRCLTESLLLGMRFTSRQVAGINSWRPRGLPHEVSRVRLVGRQGGRQIATQAVKVGEAGKGGRIMHRVGRARVVPRCCNPTTDADAHAQGRGHGQGGG